MSVLGDRLKVERERRGWTKRYAASKLGLKQVSTYANYEYGIRDPDTDMLMRMAQLYETSIDYLKGMSETKRIINDQTKNAAIEIYSRLPQEDKILIDDMIKALEKRREK